MPDMKMNDLIEAEDVMMKKKSILSRKIKIGQSDYQLFQDTDLNNKPFFYLQLKYGDDGFEE
jgi:hypothetical protein